MAARLALLAEEGQILLTRGAFDLARRAAAPPSGVSREPAAGEDAQLSWLAHGAYFFPAADEGIEIFEVGWREIAPLAAPAGGASARRLWSPSEERLLGWRPAAGQAIPLRPLWKLLERIGEGGFGEVWLARHKVGEKRVFKFCFEAERLRALKREVTLFRLMKEALGHRDDIARILDWQFDEAPFFVESEYTEAGNLVQWPERCGGIGAVPLPLRLDLAAEVASAKSAGFEAVRELALHLLAAASQKTLAAAAVLLLALAFTLALINQLHQTEAARDRAEGVSAFLFDLFQAAAPDRPAGGEEPTLRQLLARGREHLESGLDQDPRQRALLQLKLGEVYYKLGDYAAAENLYAGAIAIWRRVGGDEPQLAAASNNLAMVHRAELGEDHADTARARKQVAGLAAKE